MDIAGGEDLIVGSSYKRGDKRDRLAKKRLEKEREKLKIMYDYVN